MPINLDGSELDDLRAAQHAYVQSEAARIAAREQRDNLIRAAVEAGTRMSTIARALNISETGVRWVVARFPTNGARSA